LRARHSVEHSNGENIGTFHTDGTGKILVGTLTEDTYVVSEVAALQGYQLARVNRDLARRRVDFVACAFTWLGDVNVTVDEILAVNTAETQRDKAAEFLWDTLNIQPMTATAITKLAKERSISVRTIHRAKGEIVISSTIPLRLTALGSSRKRRRYRRFARCGKSLNSTKTCR
jgi:hypothetical protein